METLGKPGHPTYSEISDDQFAKSTNVSREQYLDALTALENFGYIRPPRRNIHSGRMEYAVADTFRDESAAKRVHGRCPGCAEIIAIDHQFIPIPHIVLRKLGACMDAASFACLMVILRYTLRVTKERGVYATPHELTINDFERHTGYSTKSISNALGKLCDEDGWALVQRKETIGKPSVYCPVLDNLYRMERREARVVSMPANRERGERSAKTENQELQKQAEVEPKSDAIESNLKPYGFCRKCDMYVTCTPVSEAQFRASKAESPVVTPKERPPRAGPTSETKPKSKFWSEIDRRRQQAIDDAEKTG